MGKHMSQSRGRSRGFYRFPDGLVRLDMLQTKRGTIFIAVNVTIPKILAKTVAISCCSSVRGNGFWSRTRMTKKWGKDVLVGSCSSKHHHSAPIILPMFSLGYRPSNNSLLPSAGGTSLVCEKAQEKMPQGVNRIAGLQPK